MTNGARPRRATLLAKQVAWTPAPRGLQGTSRNLFPRRLYLPAPKPSDLRQGGPQRPGAPAPPGDKQRGRPHRHSPHGHAAPTPSRPHDERVPGGCQLALRGAGSWGCGHRPQLQRTPQRAQGRPRQLRLQQEDAAHRER